MITTAKNKLRGLKFYGKRYLNKAIGKHYCPCCQSRVIAFEDWKRFKGMKCPLCDSDRRHRSFMIFLEQYTTILSSGRKRLLHIAPENWLKPHLIKNPALEYVTADLYRKDVMLNIDITEIPLPDDSFDVILCCHVMEHVINDMKAMKELCRVLTPDGIAILQVPVYPGKTIEDTSLADPAERERLFGLEDHFRKYGHDYKDRLEEAGFIAQLLAVKEIFTPDQIGYYGFNEDETMNICLKTEQGTKNIPTLPV